MIGIFFSILLIQITVATYNSNLSKYHTAKARYPAAQAAYQHALASYHTALAKHVRPTPVAPHAPAVPVAPVLNIASFSLPVLYLVLSIAYFFLAWRAGRRRQAEPQLTSSSSSR